MLDSNTNLHDDANDDATNNATDGMLLENQLLKLVNYTKMAHTH